MPTRSVADFYADLPDVQRATAEYLRDLVLAAYPGIREKLRVGLPFFDLSNWFIYLKASKTSGIDLCFLQGSQLTDESGLLEAHNRKMVKSVAVAAPGVPSEEALLILIYEAIEVNLQTPTSVARSRTKPQAKNR
jgi:hypothetical protein